jgi:hypothetical protein
MKKLSLGHKRSQIESQVLLFLLASILLIESSSSFAVQSITRHQTLSMRPETGLEEPKGAIVVVAKCPIPGKSKTRLAPLLGAEGSAFLAKALLSDVLVTLSECVSGQDLRA